MNIYDFLFKKFINNNKIQIIIYIIIAITILFGEYIICPIIYTEIIISLYINKITKFYNIFFILIGIWVLILILIYFKGKIENNLFPSLVYELQIELINATLENNKNNLNEIKIGNHVSRIILDSSKISATTNNFLLIILPSIIGIFMIGIFFLLINLKIGLFFLFGLILSILCILLFSKNIIELSAKQLDFFYNNIDNLNNKFSNLSNIFLNNQKEEEKTDSKLEQIEYKKLCISRFNESNKLVFFLYIISIFIFLFSILIGYKFYKNNLLTKQKYIIILIILIYYIGLCFKIIINLPLLLHYIALGIKTFNYFISLKNDNLNKINFTINSGSIKIVNLTFKYQKNKENKYDNKYIFNNFNLEIKSGERIAIYGRSGFGKSTLAKLLMNLYNYDGNIYLDNKDIKIINDNILRSNIIYVNQKTELFEDTIFENIRYGNKISNEDIINIINKFNLNNIFENLKDKYNTNCGVRGNNLSLGMQKIIILLRAYFKFNDSKVIIFDEPLAGLDFNTKKKILEFISEIDKNKTIIIITHDEEIFSIVDRKINIENISLSS